MKRLNLVLQDGGDVMEEPDYDVKKELILAKLDTVLRMLDAVREKHDIIELLDINSILLKVEKEVQLL